MPEDSRRGPPPLPWKRVSHVDVPTLPTQKKGPPPLPWKRGQTYDAATEPTAAETSLAVQNTLALAIEGEKGESVSFSEATRLLKLEGYDLEKVRFETTKLHDKWGIVRALREKGVVQSADQYGALFDGAQFSARGIEDILNRLKSIHRAIKEHYSNDSRSPQEIFGYLTEDILPVFNSGHLSYRELWKILMVDAGIQNVVSDDFENALRSDGLKGFDFLKIRLDDIPGLLNLHNLSQERQESAFQQAYWAALKAGVEAPKQSVSLISDRFHKIHLVHGRDKIKGKDLSAVEFAQQMMNVRNHPEPVSPVEDLLRWRTQFEGVAEQFKCMRAGGDYEIPHDKIPNYDSVSIYPLHVLPNGKIVTLRLIPETLEPFLMSDDPGYKEPTYGVRYVMCS